MITRLKLELRHKQLYLDQDITKPIVVKCNVDGTAEYEAGLVPVPDWLDFTADTQGLEDFTLTWKAVTSDYSEGDAKNGTNEAGSNYDKGVTLELKFHNEAFKFIYDWLMTTPCQIVNSIEARITDLDCNRSYRVLELKLDNTKYAPEDPCIVSMPLREKDDVIHVFQKTIIEDDWQKWFNKDGASVKEHPTFPFIVEKKPKLFISIYIVIIYLVGIIGSAIFSQIPFIKIAYLSWIRKTLSIFYFCPSPLIRDYIQNVCDKYGFTYNTMFDDLPENKYRDVCMFYPVSVSYRNFEHELAPSTFFLWENRTVYPVVRLLNRLKKVFNAEWYVTPNSELVFQHKSYFDNQVPLYDFTDGNDKIHGLVYTFNGKKKPAYGDYQYQLDPQDTCSNEIKWRYASIVDYDGPANNPMLEGNVNKTFDFAATAFHKDGVSEDYLEEGIKTGRTIAAVLILLGLGQLFLSSNFITVAIVTGLLGMGYIIVNDHMNDYFDNHFLNGCVRVANSEINVPRLLLWDRNTPLNRAKVARVDVSPEINPKYNEEGKNYYEEHPTNDNPGYFGTEVVAIWNYSMYFDENFKGNLQDLHEYDNPMSNPAINQNWEGSVDLCCEWLERLGVFEGQHAKIGSVVILEKRGDRTIKGRITEIRPSYKTGVITLQGNVLK